jgi:hypothetical protein
MSIGAVKIQPGLIPKNHPVFKEILHLTMRQTTAGAGQPYALDQFYIRHALNQTIGYSWGSIG